MSLKLESATLAAGHSIPFPRGFLNPPESNLCLLPKKWGCPSSSVPLKTKWMVFRCQSPSENHFVHFSAIKSGNCSWATVPLFSFHWEKTAAWPPGLCPPPRLWGLNARNATIWRHAAFWQQFSCCRLNHPSDQWPPNDSLYRNPPWGYGISRQQQESKVGQWTEHQTQNRRLCFRVQLCWNLKQAIYISVSRRSRLIYFNISSLYVLG